MDFDNPLRGPKQHRKPELAPIPSSLPAPRSYISKKASFPSSRAVLLQHLRSYGSHVNHDAIASVKRPASLSPVFVWLAGAAECKRSVSPASEVAVVVSS